MTDRLKIGQEVLIHGYVDEIRKDTIIIQNEGGYFGTVECEVTDIEMPDTNEVLDKIKADIEKAMEDFYYDEHDLGVRAGFRFALEIIGNHTKGAD